jgi:hypothetical protein
MAFAGKRGGKVSVWSGPVDQMQGGAFWGLRRSAKCPPIFKWTLQEEVKRVRPCLRRRGFREAARRSG